MVIKKTTVYSALTAMLTGLFVSIILVGSYFFEGHLGRFSIWAGIAGAFVIAFIFQPLRDAVQKVVDRVFFKAPYDYQRILGRYSHALSRPMADLDRFSKIAPYLLWKSMKLSGTSVMVLDRESHSYLVRAGNGESENLIGRSIPEDSALIQELTSRGREIDREEVNSALKAEDKLSPEERKKFENILSQMEQLKAALIIPSISESEYFNKSTLISTLNLGRKLSDETFSEEDIDFLETMAHQAAISIEYAFILEELRKNQEQIVKSEKLAVLGTTTAGIAHELKNPLTYLLTVAQSMSQDWDNPAFKESVVRMFPSEVERMKLIIDGLSDYSKTHELRLEPVDVTIVLDKVIAILGYEIKKNNVSVAKNYPSGQKVLALADNNRLVQVFMNIIANAVQAVSEKGGNLAITVSFGEREVRISVADTGPGMTQKTLQRIFDPFFTTKETGTGLGLSIVKKIVEEHKGTIGVESYPGQGTTFTVCLPRASYLSSY